MWITLAQVALGGAIGAALRFGAGVMILRALGPMAFPLGVISVNILGSFLMGFFVVLAAQKGLTAWGPFVMTGVLGGFTTFSAFSLETVTLLERGQLGLAMAYVVGSVVLSVGGLYVGVTMARGIWA
ncbi:fluoride efflux transporter CrcB [Primorskyibacter sp. S187A]|uniref:fluoride efflux transporter CrcB n=1 Tax=Primorskyibacter sp. S187A TaxID=3415130 RepID=UPI003C7A5022